MSYIATFLGVSFFLFSKSIANFLNDFSSQTVDHLEPYFGKESMNKKGLIISSDFLKIIGVCIAFVGLLF